MDFNGLIFKYFTCVNFYTFNTFNTDGTNIYYLKYNSVSKIIKLNLDLERIDTKELNDDCICTQMSKEDEFMCK